MLRFEKMAKNARRFKTLTGMSFREFDFLYAKVEKTCREEERKRLAKRPRQRAIGAGRRFALNPRDRVLPFLSCHRTSATQDVAAEVFGVGQATVSRSMDQMAPVLAKCLPTPEKLYARARRVSTLEELEDLFPQLVCLTDASEQRIQRPKRKDMEKSHFSGKAGTHSILTNDSDNGHNSAAIVLSIGKLIYHDADERIFAAFRLGGDGSEHLFSS